MSLNQKGGVGWAMNISFLPLPVISSSVWKSPSYTRADFTPVGSGWSLSWNHRMAWIGRDLRDHLVPHGKGQTRELGCILTPEGKAPCVLGPVWIHKTSSKMLFLAKQFSELFSHPEWGGTGTDHPLTTSPEPARAEAVQVSRRVCPWHSWVPLWILVSKPQKFSSLGPSCPALSEFKNTTSFGDAANGKTEQLGSPQLVQWGHHVLNMFIIQMSQIDAFDSSWQSIPAMAQQLAALATLYNSVPAMYRTCGAGFAHQLCALTVCSTVKCNFTHCQFTLNVGWDKPVNHLPWEEEQYQLIYVANQKHIIFVVFVFTGVLSLKIFWVVFVQNSLPFSFQTLVFQSNPYLSYLFHTNGKNSDSISWHMFRDCS